MEDIVQLLAFFLRKLSAVAQCIHPEQLFENGASAHTRGVQSTVQNVTQAAAHKIVQQRQTGVETVELQKIEEKR